MPLLLATPFNMGVLDDPYTHAKIMIFTHNAARGIISLQVLLGKIVSGAFVAGLTFDDKTVRRFEIANKQSPAWAADTLYSAGVLVSNGGDTYLCTTSGTSASSGGPSGGAITIADGGAVWRYAGKEADYNILVSKTAGADPNKLVYACVAEALYQWLLDTHQFVG